MTHELIRAATLLKFFRVTSGPWNRIGRAGYRPRRGFVLTFAFVALMVVPVAGEAGGRSGCPNRPTFAALTDSSGFAQRATAISVSGPNCCPQAPKISTSALTESRSQSETHCVISNTGAYCVRTRIVETSANDVQVEFFTDGGDNTRATLSGIDAARSSLIDQATGWITYNDALLAGQSGHTKQSIKGISAEDNSRLTFRINSAENVLAEYLPKRSLNALQSQYSTNSPLDGPIGAATFRYGLSEVTVLEQGTGEITEESVIRVSSNTNTSTASRFSPWGQLGNWLDAGAAPERTISATTPLEGSSLLGSSFGTGNEYTRRLALFGSNFYIPPVSPKPTK